MNGLKKCLLFLACPRPFRAERFFLGLALCMALGAIASARYHFYLQNYSPFIFRQVLPATQNLHVAELAIRGNHDSQDLNRARLDQWPWISPLSTNVSPEFGEALIPVGSDYLGVWHYTKMILRRQNPYIVNFFSHIIFRYTTGHSLKIQQSLPRLWDL